jgi:hypothetical protein
VSKKFYAIGMLHAHRYGMVNSSYLGVQLAAKGLKQNTL